MTNYSVKEFYKGKNVLVTGGAGLMGKVLIEKLLFTIPDIGNIYLLLRPKKGKSFPQRLDDMLRSPMFNRIKTERKEALDKLIPVQGDLLYEDLGLSSKDLMILSEEVSVVFHLAASLKFEAGLKDNVALNTVGTRRALDVARSLKNLEIFVHVSTAFCYPEFEVLEERFHSPSADPHDVMRLCEWLDEKQVDLLTPSLLGQHPNTYTYSKRLAESLVYDAYPDLPVVIARPSIVIPAYRDPLPGWVDNLNGPVGVMLGAGKGVIRSMLCDATLYGQVIPVDGAINAIIALAMIETSKEKPEQIPIYNVNVGHIKPTTWGEVLIMAKDYARKYPMAWPLWYPNGDLTTNYVAHEINRVLFHMLPAYFIDFLLFITGQKRFMVRIQNRISKGLQLLAYFTMRQWVFPCPNFDAIHTTLSEEENEIYLTYREDFDVEMYLQKCMEAGRVYCLKEDPTKIPMNRMFNNFLFVLDTLVKIVFWCFVLSLLAGWCAPLRNLLAIGQPVFKYLPFLGAVLSEDA